MFGIIYLHHEPNLADSAGLLSETVISMVNFHCLLPRICDWRPQLKWADCQTSTLTYADCMT